MAASPSRRPTRPVNRQVHACKLGTGPLRVPGLLAVAPEAEEELDGAFTEWTYPISQAQSSQIPVAGSCKWQFGQRPGSSCLLGIGPNPDLVAAALGISSRV